MGLAAVVNQVREGASGTSSARAAGVRALRTVQGVYQHLAQLDQRPASWGDILGGRLFAALPDFAQLDGMLRELTALTPRHGDVVCVNGDESVRLSEVRDRLAALLGDLAGMRRLAARDK